MRAMCLVVARGGAPVAPPHAPAAHPAVAMLSASCGHAASARFIICPFFTRALALAQARAIVWRELYF